MGGYWTQTLSSTAVRSLKALTFQFFSYFAISFQGLSLRSTEIFLNPVKFCGTDSFTVKEEAHCCTKADALLLTRPNISTRASVQLGHGSGTGHLEACIHVWM